MSQKLQRHLRATLLAGVLAGVPIVVTVILVRWIDEQTQVLVEPVLDRRIPLLGIVVAIIVIYLIGLVVQSLVGKVLLAAVDSLLSRLPVIKPIYEAWKQVSLTPQGKAGMYDRTVLVPVEAGNVLMLGFSSGESVPGRPELVPVFLPNCPNPVVGRLVFVPRADLKFVDLSTEEAMKLIVSSGNYVPAF